MNMNKKFVEFYRDHLHRRDQFCVYYEDLRHKLFFGVLLDDLWVDFDNPLEKHLFDLLEGESFSNHVNTWFFDYVEKQMIRNKPELYEIYLESVESGKVVWG